ncbi:MAG TPA: oxalate/formate MFS antiporter, partial [Paraburkholderia sp.]|nr:oxalate/formate MFS antiporter [Paraburkholderia sp.]
TLYTAKGTASLLVPIASVLSATGGWSLVFIVSAVVTIAAGISAKFLLAPLRSRWIESHNESQELPGALAVAGSKSSRLSHWPEQTGE